MHEDLLLVLGLVLFLCTVTNVGLMIFGSEEIRFKAFVLALVGCTLMMIMLVNVWLFNL